MPVSNTPWTLDPTTEAAYLIPWLDSDPSPNVKRIVLEYLAGVLNDPVRDYIEDPPQGNIYAGLIPLSGGIGIIYSLDWASRQVLLSHLG